MMVSYLELFHNYDKQQLCDAHKNNLHNSSLVLRSFCDFGSFNGPTLVGLAEGILKFIYIMIVLLVCLAFVLGILFLLAEFYSRHEVKKHSCDENTDVDSNLNIDDQQHRSSSPNIEVVEMA